MKKSKELSTPNGSMINLKPGDQFKLKLDIKINMTKHIQFNKLDLQEYLIEATKKYLTKHIKNDFDFYQFDEDWLKL